MLRLRSVIFTALAAVTVFASIPAKASILVEPYVGYLMGSTKNISPAFDISSAVGGARLAYEFPVVFVGLDYSTMLGGTGKSGSLSVDVTGSDLFVEVGARVPLVRAYLGFGITHDLSLATTSTVKLEGGSAVKLGVGTTILPAVAINLEYFIETYDKINGASAGTTGGANFYSLNVSLPFSF